MGQEKVYLCLYIIKTRDNGGQKKQWLTDYLQQRGQSTAHDNEKKGAITLYSG